MPSSAPADNPRASSPPECTTDRRVQKERPGAGRSVTRGTRRPRFADLVLVEGRAYQVVATIVAPTPGFWIRPVGAEDASADRQLSLGESATFRWHTGRQRREPLTAGVIAGVP